jgi:hypothetical protein
MYHYGTLSTDKDDVLSFCTYEDDRLIGQQTYCLLWTAILVMTTREYTAACTGNLKVHYRGGYYRFTIGISKLVWRFIQTPQGWLQITIGDSKLPTFRIFKPQLEVGLTVWSFESPDGGS